MTSREFKLFSRFNFVDFICMAVLAISVGGFFLAQAGHAGVDKLIQGVSKVKIDIYFNSFKTEDLEIFKTGNKAALTIRNQPVYPPMTITAVKHWPKQVAFLAPDGKKVLSFADPGQPLAHEFVVTVTDEAEITQDGYVIRGNKIKVGNQVELEGFKYRVQGVVVDINPDKQ